MDKTEATAKINELIDGVRICTVTTTNDDGQLVSRPMGLQNKTFEGELWFFTTDHSAKITHINARPQVNVSFQHDNSYVSISGEAQAIKDRDKAEELWNPALKGWFPDGIDTPDLVLLRINATSAHYWDATHNKVVTLLSYAKAAVTGTRPDVGEDKIVNLD